MRLLDSVIARSLPVVPRPIVWKIARKYIAGLDLDSAARAVAGLKARGVRATLDVLGENAAGRDETTRVRDEYAKVLERIRADDLPSGISVKLTHLGLKVDPDLAFSNLLFLVEQAQAAGRFLRIDMEDSPTTDATLSLYRRVRQRQPNVGTVLQAYLRRTCDDAAALAAEGADIRLCKGIYTEPASIAFHDPDEIRESYLRALRIFLERRARVAIATHDAFLVDAALRMCGELDPHNERHEFQMLYGVGEHLWPRLLSGGHKIRIYVPFGPEWYAYSLRRLRENPRIAGYVLRGLFS